MLNQCITACSFRIIIWVLGFSRSWCVMTVHSLPKVRQSTVTITAMREMVYIIAVFISSMVAASGSSANHRDNLVVLLRAVASLFARQHLLDIIAGIIIPSLLHLIVRDTSIHLVSPAEYIDIRSLPYSFGQLRCSSYWNQLLVLCVGRSWKKLYVICFPLELSVVDGCYWNCYCFNLLENWYYHKVGELLNEHFWSAKSPDPECMHDDCHDL